MSMYLKSVELIGFKSFGKKVGLEFTSPIASIVGPNGSGKSNVAEGFRFVLGEQSMKSLRSKRGEDLIWAGSPALPRSGRASVKVTFDNAPRGGAGKRLLDIDFSEVTIERVVHRDGQNEYLLNGSQVRLKDIIRLLAGANIGGSGYQIISQGEADRILNASPRERREMVEDALGLKLYQHKKIESERQLSDSRGNLDKAKSLRREIAPHLNFLRVQVEKIEKSREMKEELGVKLGEYLAREHAFITQETVRVKEERDLCAKELRATEEEITRARQNLSATSPVSTEPENSIPLLERSRQILQTERDKLMRELARAETELELGTRDREDMNISIVRVKSLLDRLEAIFREIDDAEGGPHTIGILSKARQEIEDFRKSFVQLSGEMPEVEDRISVLAKKLQEQTTEIERIEAELSAARLTAQNHRERTYEAERILLTQEANRRDIAGKLAMAESRLTECTQLRVQFDEEVREGIALVGVAAAQWEAEVVPEGALSEPRGEQEKRRRAIERLKIKIEESGTGNSEEIMKEYRQTLSREEFLSKEISDLEASVDKLERIISELEETMDQKFTEGLNHINAALHVFFSTLFGGGEAKLEVEKPKVRRVQALLDEEADDVEVIPEEDELYTGLSISVSLPRKKVRGLEVLSGGERALTSIALIFSMSQVNPPPFLILDETDAALDEANSKRYADMIRELGKKSQLIVITHNRATMAAAGELYGVTMGSDGVSKVLSIKLEEAAKVAK